METTKQFKVSEEGLMRTKARVTKTMVFVGVLGLLFSHFINQAQQKEPDISTEIPVMALLVIVFIGSTIWTLKRTTQLVQSYTVSFTNNAVVRGQFNTPTITIPYNEITEIIKNYDGSFSIKGKSKFEAIGIYALIENHEELEKILESLKPVTQPAATINFLHKYNFIIILATFATMGIFYLSTNKLLIAISGISIISLLCYSLYTIQKSKSLDNTTRRSSWATLLVLFSAIFSMLYRLFVLQQ